MQLRYAYGTENILEVAPSALRNATPRTDLSAEDCLVAAPEWAAATQANEGMKIYVTVCRGFVSEWLASRTTTTLPAPPVGLDAAYRLFFEHFQVHDDSVRNLIGVVMAAKEPLSSAHLDSLGLLGACSGLPGWRLLFEDREHLLQIIHQTLREFLLDAERSGSYAADIRRGHIVLARSCLEILRERSTGPILAYALRHGHVSMPRVGTPALSVKFCPLSTLPTLSTLSTLSILSTSGQFSTITGSRLSVRCGLAQVHLTEVLSHPSKDMIVVVQEWFGTFLQPR